MINEETSRRLKDMRCMMGLSQKDICRALKMNPGQYSEIEAGRLSAEKAIGEVHRRFREWKETELKRLEIRIKYINSL